MDNRPKILLTRRWPDRVERIIAERWNLCVSQSDRALDQAELCQAMREFDIICPTVTDQINRTVLSVPDRRVRLIANYGAGFDHIDLQAAREAAIVVTNTPDVLTEATAELAITLMLMASRRASEGQHELRSGEWTGWRPTHLLGRGLAGRTLALLGFGRIGQATAAIAKAGFAMQIAYHAPRRASAETELRYDARYYPDIGGLVADADILSIHCRGGPETHHLVNEALIGRMKSDAIIVNTARGSIIDETALAAALSRGAIAAAGLDVFENEPDIPDALLNCPNAVLLPHLGSATLETRTQMGMKVVENIAAFLAGRPPADRVN